MKLTKRINLKSSQGRKKNGNCKVMDVLTKLTVENTLQYKLMSNHHVVCLKLNVIHQLSFSKAGGDSGLNPNTITSLLLPNISPLQPQSEAAPTQFRKWTRYKIGTE